MITSLHDRFDEIGKYDVPAMINYILNTTGRQKLSYIGHSMGCATFYIAMKFFGTFC